MSGQTDYSTRFKRPYPKGSQKLNVVLGIIRRGDSFLLTQRAKDAHLGGLWEFPGGKIALDEAAEDGLHREIKEELGIDVTIDRFFTLIRYHEGDFDVTLNAFECSIKSGLPKSLEGQTMDWVSLDQLSKLAMPKANRLVVERLNLEHTIGMGINTKISKEIGLGRAGHQGPFAIRP